MFLYFYIVYPLELQCEKHSKKEEAILKLKEGVKFDEVARELSEDKARQGSYMFSSNRILSNFRL